MTMLFVDTHTLSPTISLILYSKFSQLLLQIPALRERHCCFAALECLLKASFRQFDKSFSTKMAQKFSDILVEIIFFSLGTQKPHKTQTELQRSSGEKL